MAHKAFSVEHHKEVGKAIGSKHIHNTVNGDFFSYFLFRIFNLMERMLNFIYNHKLSIRLLAKKTCHLIFHDFSFPFSALKYKLEFHEIKICSLFKLKLNKKKPK